MIVTIGIPTYRRPDSLAQLLEALPAQRAAVLAQIPECTQVRALVVDNDPAESARAVCADRPDWVAYDTQPRPGISAVRNRLIDGAGDARLLAFIDDDELPEPGWLVELVRTWRTTGASAVGGLVVPHYLVDPDPWLVAGGFFVRRSLPTGTSVSAASTGNLLLDLEEVRAHGLRFEESFGLSGGEDTRFSQDLRAVGGRIVFSAEAVVRDEIPAQRLTRRWVLQRALSHGNTTGVLALGGARPTVRARVLAGGLGRVGAGAARSLAGLATHDQAHEAKGLRLLMRGGGIALAAAGLTYTEYARGGRRLTRTPSPEARPRALPGLAHAAAGAPGGSDAADAGRTERRPNLLAAATNWGPIHRIDTNEAVATLTFDDGPDPVATPEILDVLARHGVTATFFCLLTAARRSPETLRAVAAAGHEVALHGVDHRSFLHRFDLARELADGAAELADLAKAPVRYVRPPYGEVDARAWLALRRAGLECVLWSSTTWDWKDVTPQERIAKVEAGARPGAIVLAHDGAAGWADRVPPEAAGDVDKPALVDAIARLYGERGIHLVDLSTALATGRPLRRPPRPWVASTPRPTHP